jgi:pyridoxal phosphate enzyme (YggS family)
MSGIQAEQSGSIQSRYRQVLEQIGEAALRGGRKPETVRVVVVTKMQPAEILRAVVRAGITEIGENYAEEALEKMSALGENPGLHWHMIGHVQSRKARLVANHFSLLHSLDSLKLAGRLDEAAREAGKVLPVLLECNVSGEASKFGLPAWDQAQWAELRELARAISQMPGISLRGLMTMPPYPDRAEDSRPFFRRLRALQDYLRQSLPALTWDELSMGTSLDFICAVEEGATLVRIGTAIVGPRPQA